MDDSNVDHEVSDAGYSARVSVRGSVTCMGKDRVMATYRLQL